MPYMLVLTSLSPFAPQVDGDFDAWMEVLCLVYLYHGGALHTEMQAAIFLLCPSRPLHACVSHGPELL